jgi:DNA-binding transcriptional ArsR family regulator
MSESEQLDAVFAALANPTRRAILARLAEGQATVNELAEPFEMSLPAVSKHIRVLEEAGFVARGRDAQFRPCSLDAKPLAAVASWTDQYRHIWDARFEMMAKVLQNMKVNTGE